MHEPITIIRYGDFKIELHLGKVGDYTFLFRAKTILGNTGLYTSSSVAIDAAKHLIDECLDTASSNFSELDKELRAATKDKIDNEGKRSWIFNKEKLKYAIIRFVKHHGDDIFDDKLL